MSALPVALARSLADQFDSPPTLTGFVGGGSINQAAQIRFGMDRFFLKWKANAPPQFFEIEARGLDVLCQAGALRVPSVIGHGQIPDQRLSYLVLEWIEEDPTAEPSVFAVRLGRSLAELHKLGAPSYGLDHDNYIGELPQTNHPLSDWPSFYRDRRIAPQVQLARQRRRLNPERERLLMGVMDQMESLLEGCAGTPSLLHGDLWSGNFMIAQGNQPVVIDPAVYYGDREVELAFTELFGGFPRGFMAAYHDAYPVDRGYARRRPIYQLYPLLVHLNLFGEGYGLQVDSICRAASA